MKKFKARCIQWDKTDDNGSPVAIELPEEVTVTCEDLQLPANATQQEIENELSVYLLDYYGFYHFGYFFEEVDD